MPITTGVMDRFNFSIRMERIREILIKRWWILALGVCAGLAIGGYNAYRQPDLYMSTGRMMLKPVINIPLGKVYSEELTYFLGTQIQLMREEVLGEALARMSEFEAALEAPPQPAFQVARIRETTIFSLSVTSTSPEYSRRLLDAIMNAFIAYKKQLRAETSETTAATLLQQRDQAEQTWRKAEDELCAFQKQHNMAYLEGQGNMAVQYLVDLKRRLADLRRELALVNAETAEQPMLRTGVSSLSTGDTNLVMASRAGGETPTSRRAKLQDEYANQKNAIALLKSEQEALAALLRPKHPKIVQIAEDIKRKEQLLKLVIQQTKEEINAVRYSMTKQQETLTKDVEEWEKIALEVNQKATGYEVLKGNVVRFREQYNLLVKWLQDIKIGSDVEQETITISKAASVGVWVGPNRTRTLLVAGFFGLAMALALILLLEKLDDRIRNVEELQSLVAAAVLGQVPNIAESEREKQPANYAVHDSLSEAFRNIRSSLVFSPAARSAKILAITSAMPGDGKTTCAANLAICFSQVEEERTLLIDTDLRRMSVHKYFGLKNDAGIAEVLRGHASLAECVMSSGFPNLDLLLIGVSGNEGAEVFLGQKFKDMLRMVGETYRRVILDMPPVLALDDPLSIAPLLDGVIVVVRANQTPMQLVNSSLELLQQRGATILGLVLNGVDLTSAKYYYRRYYSHYYSTVNGRGQAASKSPERRSLADRHAKRKISAGDSS